MSRSTRKTPIFGNTTASTEKSDKRRWNKAFRRITKQLVRRRREAPKKTEAVSNVWDGQKDGKTYWGRFAKKDMRK